MSPSFRRGRQRPLVLNQSGDPGATAVAALLRLAKCRKNHFRPARRSITGDALLSDQLLTAEQPKLGPVFASVGCRCCPYFHAVRFFDSLCIEPRAFGRLRTRDRFDVVVDDLVEICQLRHTFRSSVKAVVSLAVVPPLTFFG